MNTAAPGAPPLQAIAVAAASDAGGLSVDLLADFLPVLVDRVASGERLPSSALAGYGKAGRAAATSGVALRALLDLYLSAAWRLWRHLPVVALIPIASTPMASRWAMFAFMTARIG